MIFGTAGLGAKTGAVNSLKSLKSTLTPDKWNALREEAVIRLFRNQNGNNLNGDMKAIFSGNKFSTAFRTANKEPELMRTLFDDGERALLDQFKRVALRATNKPNDAMNPSGTGAELARIMQKMAGGGILTDMGMSIVNKLTGGFKQASKAMKATSATRPTIRKKQVLPGGLLGGIAAGTSSQYPVE